MPAEARAWTRTDLQQLRRITSNEQILAFVMYHTLPSDIPKLFSRVSPPAEWASNPHFGKDTLRIISELDLVPLEWFVQREHNILDRVQKDREPWLNRVTLALEAMGKTLSLLKGPAVGDWVTWTERICSEMRFVSSSMVKKLRAEGGGTRGTLSFPVWGICDDWKLEFAPFLELPTIRAAGFQEQLVRRVSMGFSPHDIEGVMRTIRGLLEDYAESTRENSQSIGHEILFWACMYRQAISQGPCGLQAEYGKQNESVWKWWLWESTSGSDEEAGIAYGWHNGKVRRMGYVDRYVQTRENPVDMDMSSVALLSATSDLIWSVFRATDIVQESIDAAADCQNTVIGSRPWRMGLARTVVQTMRERCLVSAKEYECVCANDDLAAAYAIELDNECRAIRATCCLLGRVVTLSVGHNTGRGPFVPHRGVLFGGPVPTDAGRPHIKRMATESFAALRRVGAALANGTSVQNKMDDANAMVVAASTMASHFKCFSHVRTCADIVATCANRLSG